MRDSLGTARLVLFLPILASAGWIGCGSARMPPRAGPMASDCARPRAPADVATLRVGLSGALDPDRITSPETDAERLVFGHLYETLVRLDCAGRPQAALARSWARDRGGRSWRFTLRDDARFWDGRELTADDVLNAWFGYGGHDFLASIGAVTDSIRVEGTRELMITFRGSAPTVPTAFADAALTVVRPSAISAWPRGTGPYRPVEERTIVARSAGRRTVRTERMPGRDIDGPDRLDFVIESEEGARDLIDEGIEVLITRDPTTIRYAATRGDRVTAPLPWDRVYALILHDSGSSDRMDAVSRPALDELLDDLARDAVHADARPSAVDSVSGPVHGCVDPARAESETIRATGDGTSASHILFPRDDPVARGLAERLVALRGRPYDPGPAAIVHALLGGAESWIALGIDRRRLEGARRPEAPLIFTFNRLRYRICPSRSGLDAGVRVMPLVETRAHAIVGRQAGGVRVDGEGTPLLFRPREPARVEWGR